MDLSAILGGTRNELVPKLARDDYCAVPAISPSVLVEGLKSMKHLRHAWYNPRPDTPDLEFGRAVHCLLFEPRVFEARYTFYPGRRAGKAYQDFQDEHPGAEVLKESDYNALVACARAILDEPPVQPLVKAGQAEVAVFAGEYGMQCRGRMDWLSSDGVLVDLKTTRNIEGRAFGHDFYRYHYDVKLGLYRRWVRNVTGCHYRTVVIAAEKFPPYDVTVTPIPDAVLDQGAIRGLRVLEQLRRAIESDRWPGIAGGAEYELVVPGYEMEEEEPWEEQAVAA